MTERWSGAARAAGISCTTLGLKTQQIWQLCVRETDSTESGEPDSSSLISFE